MKKIVVGVGNWPENGEYDFEITTVQDGESDEEAILRAKSYYDDEQEVYIREVEE